MLKIRLKRIGRKKKAFYKIILIENLSKREGKALIEFGYYNPLKKIIKLDNILISKSLNEGAYPTDTVRHFLIKILKNKYVKKL
jgi:small subunit ribosomal protein S16